MSATRARFRSRATPIPRARRAALAALAAVALFSVFTSGCALLAPAGGRDPGAPGYASPETAPGASVNADSSDIQRALVPVWTRGVGRGVSAGIARVDSVVILGTANRRILALRLRDGGRSWIRGTRGPFSAAVAASADRVYAVTDGREGLLRSISAVNGGFAWIADTGASIAAPLIDGPLVVTANRSGRVTAVQRTTGHIRWSARLDGEVRAAPLAIGDSLVVIATLGGRVHVLAIGDGAERNAFGTGCAVDAPLHLTPGGLLIIPDAAHGVEARRLPGGERAWRHKMPDGCAAAVEEGDAIIAISPGGLLDCIDLDYGGSTWTVQLPGIYDGALTAGARTILAGGTDGVLRIVSRTGRYLGEWNAGEPIVAPPLLHDGTVFVAGTHGHVWLLAATGDSLTGPLDVRYGLPNPYLNGSAGFRADPRATTLYSEPFDARVYTGDSLLGTTPLDLSPLDLHAELLQLRYPGFAPFALPTDSLWESPPPHRIRLTPMPEAAARSRPNWEGRAAIALVGTVVSAGGAILARSEADREFDRYRETGDRARQRQLFDGAERWDRVSLAGWGLTQVGAALTVYFLVRGDEVEARPARIDAGWKQ